MHKQFNSVLFGNVKVEQWHDFISGYFWKIKFQDTTQFIIQRKYNHDTKTYSKTQCVIQQCTNAIGYQIYDLYYEDFIAKLQTCDDINFKIWLYSKLQLIKYKNQLARIPKPKPKDFECSDYIRENVFLKLAKKSDFGMRLYNFLFPNRWDFICLPKIKKPFPKIDAKQFVDVQPMDKKGDLNFDVVFKWSESGSSQGLYGNSKQQMASLLQKQAQQLLDQLSQE